MNREQWLRGAADWIDQNILKPHNVRLPEKWAISVGFPKGSAKAIGQCWPTNMAADSETTTILISPVLGNHDLVNLLQVIVHECIHAAVGNKHKHGGEFKRVARAVGLEGKLTATYVSEGSALAVQLLGLAEGLGEYPHVALVPRKAVRGGDAPERKGGEDGDGDGDGGSAQSRWVRYQSTQEAKYTVVVSAKSVEQWGAPKDPWGNDMEVKS